MAQGAQEQQHRGTLTLACNRKLTTRDILDTSSRGILRAMTTTVMSWAIAMRTKRLALTLRNKTPTVVFSWKVSSEGIS